MERAQPSPLVSEAPQQRFAPALPMAWASSPVQTLLPPPALLPPQPPLSHPFSLRSELQQRVPSLVVALRESARSHSRCRSVDATYKPKILPQPTPPPALLPPQSISSSHPQPQPVAAKAAGRFPPHP